MPIRELADEVERQPSILEKASSLEFPRANRGSLFVGAGDSYAAALAAQHASGGSCMALDPYVLATSPEFADGRDVFFISVSGRTSSNALAAVRVRKRARRTTALTAVTASRLAGLVENVVRLPMKYKPRTPGMLSFSLSLLAVLRILGVDGPCDFAGALIEARKDPLGFAGRRGTTYILGNSLAYPVALYSAAKAYEVAGTRAHAELLEEFSHLELFSLKKTDFVNSFACFDPSGLAGRLGKALGRHGFGCRVVGTWGRSAWEELFHAVFASQLSVLRMAAERRITMPRFLSARAALEVSDTMVY